MYQLQQIRVRMYKFKEDYSREGQVYCQTEDGLEEALQEEGEEEDRASDLDDEESEEIVEDDSEEDSDESEEEEDAVGQLTAGMADLNLGLRQLVPPQNCTNTNVYRKVLKFLENCRGLTKDLKYWIISPFIGSKRKSEGMELFLPTTLEMILTHMHQNKSSATLKIVHKKRSPDNQMYVVGGNGNVNVDYIYQKEGQEFHCKLIACEPKKKKKAGDRQAMVPILWTSANFTESHMRDKKDKNVEWLYTESVTVRAWRDIKAKLGLNGMQVPHIGSRSEDDGGLLKLTIKGDDKIRLKKRANGFTYIVRKNYRTTAIRLGYQDSLV